MKSYKEYEKKYIGMSDIANLILAGSILTQEFNANKISVYRAGEMGCIIQLFK